MKDYNSTITYKASEPKCDSKSYTVMHQTYSYGHINYCTWFIAPYDVSNQARITNDLAMLQNTMVMNLSGS